VENFKEEEIMVQWIGVALTIIGMVYNGFQQRQNIAAVQPQLTVQQPVVQSTQPVRYYQAAFDPNSGKIYFLYPDGKWYEQIPQIRTDQTQYPPNLAVGQGAQQPSVGQRNPQQYAQTTANPWLR
jgi:hypothetical protein